MLRRTLADILRGARQAQRQTKIPAFVGKIPTRPGAAASAGRHDEWGVLQDMDSPEVVRLLRAEDESAQIFFSETAEFEARVQNEAAYLLKPETETTFEIHGSWQYFQKHTPEGFVVFCRTPACGGSVDEHEVLLDTSELARNAGTGFADVVACKVNDDHSVLAYVVDVVGDETWELHMKSIGPKGLTWNVNMHGVRNLDFLNGGEGAEEANILAVHVDPVTRRSARIVHHRLNQHGSVGEPNLLWDERNEAAYLEVFRTKNREMVIVSSNTKDTSEVRAVRTARKSAVQMVEAQVLLPPREGVEYFVEHHAKSFLVISNHERSDFAAYWLSEEAVSLQDGGWQHLKYFFTPPGGFHVTDADVLSRWMVLYGHDAAEPRVCAVQLEQDAVDGNLHAAPRSYLATLPSPVGSVEPGMNADHDADVVRFTFRSPLEPGAMYNLDLQSEKVELVRRREWFHSHLGPDAFACERVEYPTRDGERVPLTLVRPKPEVGERFPRPCLLNVYGAYGTYNVPDFRPEHLVLLRRGWVIAWAHVRGGGEKGRSWHTSARQLQKAVSVHDLADGVNFLLARGIAAPGGLCAKAVSAGGLTLGALLNSPKYAAMVAGAILEVSFLDPLTGMSDPSLPLTVHEFAEWGDPRNPEHEANLRSLSPYENIGSHEYPQIYVSCARADSRVPPWMPMKYAARLRARTPEFLDPGQYGGGRRRASGVQGRTADKEMPRVVVHCADSGHSGSSDWHGRSEEFARQIAFLHKATGLPLM